MLAGQPLGDAVIATLAPPFPIDNMEGIAVDRSGPAPLLWMISDDNGNPLQRTLLMRFDVGILAQRCG